MTSATCEAIVETSPRQEIQFGSEETYKHMMLVDYKEKEKACIGRYEYCEGQKRGPIGFDRAVIEWNLKGYPQLFKKVYNETPNASDERLFLRIAQLYEEEPIRGIVG